MMLSLLFFLRQTSCKFSCSLYMRFFLLKRKSYCVVLLGPRSSPRGATPGPLSLRPSRACTSVQPGGCAKCECTCTSVRCGGVQGVRASAVCLWNVQGEGVRGVHGGKTRAGSACSRATQGCARVQRTHALATWGWNACARAVGGVCRVCMCNEGRGAGGWGGHTPPHRKGETAFLQLPITPFLSVHLCYFPHLAAPSALPAASTGILPRKHRSGTQPLSAAVPLRAVIRRSPFKVRAQLRPPAVRMRTPSPTRLSWAPRAGVLFTAAGSTRSHFRSGVSPSPRWRRCLGADCSGDARGPDALPAAHFRPAAADWGRAAMGWRDRPAAGRDGVGVSRPPA